ncbi:AAA family ATPase [Kineococcus indalonis]|uniref:AAA family ATPase n=1 Tax=Kineococcus indalonis TaxID=2696566 RepID=UPI00196B3D19|nr:LuxR family transcriptional regulator [Kineococcus indalonis]
MGTPRELVGRDRERRRVHELLGRARNGRGGALLITGDPGIGKTALLDGTLGEPAGLRLLRVDGYEAESTIPFAALQRLLVPLREHLPSLPAVQQQALRVAAGAVGGAPPDRFLVGLGVLGLLAAAGGAGPVVCAVDDAHLLDEESLDALAFVARRLEAESVALLLAAREEPSLVPRAAGVPALHLAGLEQEAAVALLRASLPRAIEPVAAARIATATGGNPLALIDLAGELGVERLTEAGFAEEPFPAGRHLEAHYLRRVRHLPAPVQRWLLVAAADSTGAVDVITAAARELGVPGTAADEAEAAGLVELDGAVRFRHPMVESAAYGAAAGPERRRVHRALAAATAALGLVELQAWHAARAALGTDAAVADQLERVADLAGRRGGLSSRASVLVRAAQLSPAGEVRSARLVAAAEAALGAGAAQRAQDLLGGVDEEVLGPLARGRLASVRATRALFTADPALTGSAAQMLRAAEHFHGHDTDAEQQALITAFCCALPAERLVHGTTLQHLGRRLREGAGERDGPASTVLRALSALILLPYAEAVPVVRRAVDLIDRLPPQQLLRYGTAGVPLATALWDAAARRACLQRTADAARDAGSPQLLDTVLWTASLAELQGGTPRRAGQHVEQVRELRRALGYDAEHVVNVAWLAWSGAPRPQVQAVADAAAAAGLGGVHDAGVSALAVRDLAEGRYRDAFCVLAPLVEEPFLHVTPLIYPDLVEAAVRSGHEEHARRAAGRLDELAAANGSVWALGVAQRSRALLEQEPAAVEACFHSALDALATPELQVELARAHLLHGEWLRRCRRRSAAKEQLHRAAALFEDARAPAFAQRARRELAALGERSPSPRAGAGPGRRAGAELTAQEAAVARLAASGATNAEIGATLFLSVNTVDYHLRKVFAKLGISSRRQLADRSGELPR